MKDTSKRFLSAPDYFESGAKIWMRMSRCAAVEVAKIAFKKGYIIEIIEGGVWQGPGFMPRTSCIWHCAITPPYTDRNVSASNRDAKNFILVADLEIDTFILTSRPYEQVNLVATEHKAHSKE